MYSFLCSAEPPERPDLEGLIAASGKLHLVDRMAAKLKAQGHRLIIFTQARASAVLLLWCSMA